MPETNALLTIELHLDLLLLHTSATDVTLQVFNLLYLLAVPCLQISYFSFQIDDEMSIALEGAVIGEFWPSRW